MYTRIYCMCVYIYVDTHTLNACVHQCMCVYIQCMCVYIHTLKSPSMCVYINVCVITSMYVWLHQRMHVTSMYACRLQCMCVYINVSVITSMYACLHQRMHVYCKACIRICNNGPYTNMRKQFPPYLHVRECSLKLQVSFAKEPYEGTIFCQRNP